MLARFASKQIALSYAVCIELTQLTHIIATRVGGYLERQDLLERDIGQPYLTSEALGGDDETPMHQLPGSYELKTLWRNGTTHVIFEPLDFISRLVSQVPRPRVNLTRFHGHRD